MIFTGRGFWTEQLAGGELNCMWGLLPHPKTPGPCPERLQLSSLFCLLLRIQRKAQPSGGLMEVGGGSSNWARAKTNRKSMGSVEKFRYIPPGWPVTRQVE